MSDAADWSRIEAALDELLALPEARRAEALARLAGDDAALRAELENLLAETRAPDTLLDRPAISALQPEAQPWGSLPAGARLGAWRVDSLIGRGGMGEVYRAERADGQFEQQVALKLIRRDAAGEPKRFTAERQILARLEHPGIARLLDGGVAEDGRPWMAMELVQGGPITEWCRGHQAGLEQRLQLFMAACEAVAYAHRNLVIHRDLKPGNVMVTAAGAVKLLDFGIAKLLKAEGTAEGAAEAEQTRQVPLTLGYAAPEQLAGGAVTTAADVYALGMLLYELLSGRRPWALHELSTAAALDKVLREPPPPPSRAAAQIPDAPLPPRLLHGDLDAIVAKALRKEPDKRYATVEALREDVARHLAGDPVAARAGARLYAFSRFVGRNRLMVAAAALLLLTIVAGSLGIAWQARRTEAEARKATAVKDFVVGIFNANGLDNPDGAKARSATAEQLLDLGAKRIHDDMKDVPEVRAELLGTIGKLYADLNLSEQAIGLLQEQVNILRAQGSGFRPQLAEAEVRLGSAQALADRDQDAERTLNAAIGFLNGIQDRDSMSRARCLFWLGHVAYQTRPISDLAAERYVNESLHILETAHPNDALRITALIELGRIAGRRKDYAAAEATMRQALALQKVPPFNSRPSDLASVHMEYGDILLRAQRYTEAEKELRKGIAFYIDQVGPTFPQTLRGQEDLAGLLYETGRLKEARVLMSETLQALERVRGINDVEWTGDTRVYFARLLLSRGELEQADHLFERSVDIFRNYASNSAYLAIALRWQAELLTAEGRWNDAQQSVTEAKTGLARIYGERHERYAGVLLAEANLHLAQRDVLEAGRLYQQVIDGWAASADAMPDSYVYARLGLARVRLLQERPGEAEELAGDVLARVLASPQASSFLMQEAASRLWLGEAQRQQGKLPQAQENLRRAVTLYEGMDDPSSPWLAQARIVLANCLLDQNERREAADLLAVSSEALAQHPQLGSQFLRSLQQARARLQPTARAA